MKKKKQKLIIPFVGLKDGIHHFEFSIDSAFFEQFDFSIIQEAKFEIGVELEKKPTLLNLLFKLEGSIQLQCDRCNEDIDFKTNSKEELIVKFGDDSFDQTDEIKVISNADHELDITKEVYELIHLLLPSKIVHDKKSNCNQEVLKKLKELNQKKESIEIDPRWATLSKLKDND